VTADPTHKQAAQAGDLEHSVAALPELHPIAEAPYFKDVPPWPWPIADCRSFSFIRLSGDMTDLEVGSVMAQLVGDNNVESKSTTAGLLAGAIGRSTRVAVADWRDGGNGLSA